MSKTFTFVLFLMSSVFLVIQNSWAQHQLRVGHLDLEPGVRLVLIGIASSPTTHRTSIDFYPAGFRGNGLDQIDPKYLLSVDAQGIVDVFSFELESRHISTRHPLPRLISISSAKSEKVNRFLTNTLIGTGKSLGFPVALFSTLGQLPRKKKENRKKFLAAYLMELVNQALPPHHYFPELLEALAPGRPEFAERYLKQLGEALLIRFNPQSNWAGVTIPNRDGEFYDRWRNIQQGYRNDNQSYLIRYANEENLVVISYGNDFALVLINPDAYRPWLNADSETYYSDDYEFHRRFMGLGSESMNPVQILESLEMNSNSNEILPWYLVSFNNQKGPVELFNFIYPDRYLKEVSDVENHQLKIDLAGSFIPFSNLLLKKVDRHWKEKHFKKEDMRYLERVFAYGATLALAETQVHPSFIPTKDLSKTVLERALKQLKVEFALEWKSKIQQMEELPALLLFEAERRGHRSHGPSRRDLDLWKKVYSGFLRRYLNQNRPPLIKEVSRSPSSLNVKASSNSGSSLPPRNPLILFFVDGLRPDRFRKAAEQGLMPYLSSLFVKRGVEFESYTSRSLTLPSWATIMTGFEPDFHGIRSNTVTSRVQRKVTDNYTHVKKDLLEARNWKKNRAFRRLEENQVGEPGKVWFPGYFDSAQVAFNYMPISNGATSVATQIIDDFLSHSSAYINHSRYFASALDLASAVKTAKLIRKDSKGELRLIMNWYAAVDEASHYNNDLLPKVYREIDLAVGEVLEAAKAHPHLRNATVLLISDHGHSGGYDLDNHFAANTGLNLVRFLAGDLQGYKNYRFVVGSSAPPEPKFNIGALEFFLHPDDSYYPEKKGRPTALLDYSGDSLAQVYIVENRGWGSRYDYSDLSPFISVKDGKKKNVLFDLLNLKVNNLMVTDPTLFQRITSETENYPVALLAMALPSLQTRKSADELGLLTPERSTRDPVLVLARGNAESPTLLKSALIFTQSDAFGNDRFRYVVLKNFSQDRKTHRVQGTVSLNPQDDPLGYVGNVLWDSDYFLKWRTDREWLNLARDQHPWPTAIFSLARSLTLAPRYHEPSPLNKGILAERHAEIPEFILIANRGFGFHSGAPLESDHGGLSREEVRSSLFVSSLIPDEFSKPAYHYEFPILTRDIMPTVLEIAGLGQKMTEPLPLTQGVSFKLWIDKYRTLSSN